MKIAIMQPYIFPYIGYFQLINAVDKFILLDDVSYINKGWINRNRIQVGGSITPFTIPLKKSSQNKLIKDIEIHYDSNWRSKLIKTIEFAYKKAPCFEEVSPIINDIINCGEVGISNLIYYSLLRLSNYFGINTQLIPSSAIFDNGHLKSQNRIIDICLQEQADCYYNPIGGVDLYMKENFRKNNIELIFLESIVFKYKQGNFDYIPSLSIIDVMMYNSRDEIVEQLNKYKDG